MGGVCGFSDCECLVDSDLVALTPSRADLTIVRVYRTEHLGHIVLALRGA